MSELSVLEKKRLAATPERRAELQAQLLTAIETLLGDGASYPEISVERLIRAAGISRQTFYVYFDDKADLLDRLADDVVAELVASSWEFWLLSSEPSRDALLERMAPAVALYRKHELLLTALADVAGSNARAREKLRAILTYAADALAAAIRDGQAQGLMRAELDPDVTAAWLVWMAERGLSKLVAGVPDAQVERRVRALADILWFTLYGEC